ncbi:hypothetical protein NZD89_18460 [Alicyclobacillus fastidiosus]|uniref:Uncharacterized protein n=1 Tax=Alicyclobacillus fastidiosus TaxID=392011 RepID=A0ABY6ZDY1_9BACL|nr:hypothetical protein [Alicyclobacillus fastidiosus]WAH40340.1 hypothetical protein NZD89_18460 [Alicyclobacillus fastidiosus]GMA61724.1 hypothetical protein GCM10025859_21640 [Alicyclobacillus fastidiosus]
MSENGKDHRELGGKLLKKAHKESIERIRKQHDPTRPNAKDIKQRDNYLRYLEK